MKITDRNLFGAFLNSIDKTETKVIITENSGETTEGVIIGYTRGGYPINGTGEIQVATVLVLSNNLQYLIKVENISSIEETE